MCIRLTDESEGRSAAPRALRNGSGNEVLAVGEIINFAVADILSRLLG
jgi:hypothetical protein